MKAAVALKHPAIRQKIPGAILGGSNPRLNVEDGAELRVAHTETHSWSIDVTGTIWARKRVEVTGIEGLLAEAVSWLLARRLRVPVPDAAVTLSGDLSWLSKQITPVVHWDAIHQGGITNLMDLGKVLVLDVRR